MEHTASSLQGLFSVTLASGLPRDEAGAGPWLNSDSACRRRRNRFASFLISKDRRHNNPCSVSYRDPAIPHTHATMECRA